MTTKVLRNATRLRNPSPPGPSPKRRGFPTCMAPRRSSRFRRGSTDGAFNVDNGAPTWMGHIFWTLPARQGTRERSGAGQTRPRGGDDDRGVCGSLASKMPQLGAPPWQDWCQASAPESCLVKVSAIQQNTSIYRWRFVPIARTHRRRVEKLRVQLRPFSFDPTRAAQRDEGDSMAWRG